MTQENAEIQKLEAEFTKSWGELKGLLDTQADEMRKHGETSDQTAKGIKTVEETIAQLDKEVKGFTDRFKNLETKMNRPEFGGAGGEEHKSAGELFASSEEYKRMMETGANSSGNVQLKSFFEQKATLTTVGVGGALTQPYRVPTIVAPVDRRLTMRDLLNVQGTTSNAITFIQETGFTNAAAGAAETTLKPESSLTFDVETATVKTIAHWIPATRQIIADAPMLRNYVDNRLIYGLKFVEEQQFLFGTGAGENLQGIMTHADVQDAGAATGTAIDAIRHSITLAALAGYPVSGIVLHPTDWEAIEIAKGTDGHYIWVNVTTGGQPRLWAVPVVESLSMTEGDYLVGAFGLGAQVWDREQANVRVSEHHADYFARNMIAILAEERLAMTIYRPESFVKGSFA